MNVLCNFAWAPSLIEHVLGDIAGKLGSEA
jgi:hypothetical protein